MKISRSKPSPARRLAYSFLAFVAGEAILLVYLVGNALHERAMLIAVHMGEPARQVPMALELFALYTSFAFVGWLLVGVPVVLFCSPTFIVGLSWPLRLVMGTALGPLSLFLVLLLLMLRIHTLSVLTLMGGFPSVFSIVISLPAFLVYAELLRRDVERRIDTSRI